MKTSVSERRERGKKFENECISYLTKDGFRVVYLGVENFPGLCDFSKGNKSPGGVFLRNAPDIAAMKDGIITFFECKSTPFISLFSYETCLSYAISCPVVLLVQNNGQVFNQFVDKVKFKRNEWRPYETGSGDPGNMILTNTMVPFTDFHKTERCF